MIYEKAWEILICCSFLTVPFIGYAQILNGDFETWSDTIAPLEDTYDLIEDAHQGVPSDWKIMRDFDIGFYRTTDAYSGEFAAVLQTWLMYVINTMYQEGDLTDNPKSLDGMYKYLLNNWGEDTISTDVAIVEVYVFNIEGDTIGRGINTLNSASYYIPFRVPIVYNIDAEADSYSLLFTSSQKSCSLFSGECKFLFLDDITFNYTSSSETSLKDTDIIVYPNPSSGNVQFSKPVASCQVYNTIGELVSTFQNVETINLPSENNFYILKIKDLEGIISIRKVTIAE